MKSTTIASQASFRDPAGSLVIEGDRVFRNVKPEHVSETLTFLNSKLAEEWVGRGELIRSDVPERAQAGHSLTLSHPRVFFPSYPWEWTARQLGASAELTLNFCDALIREGRILKDATPLNVLLDGPRPVFVDLLSVERRDPQEMLWMAYGQFVRTFLLPLAANQRLGWPLSLMLNRRDGYEPEDLYKFLGPLEKMRAPWRTLVTLPAWLNGGNPRQQRKIRPAPEIAEAVLRKSLRSLRHKLGSLMGSPAKSHWSGYRQTATHYSSRDLALKTQFVRDCMLLARPSHVLDVGANTGFFSRLAAANGARVVAWDTDTAATEQAWLEARAEQADVLPLVADFARPTPAVGWNNAETISLLDRARDRFDMVMMLAVLHHVLVRDQIPLDFVARLAREMTRNWLIVEWVGPEDEKFRSLSNGRDGLYSHLTERTFLDSFSRYFYPVRRIILENQRSLHLLRTNEC